MHQRTLTVVIGPPASGKSTFVAMHAMPGDIVVDFDRIANKIAGTTGWDHAPEVRRMALAKWRLVRASALKSKRSAWIIHSIPDAVAMSRYRAAGARIHVCDPGEDVVRARVAAMRPDSSVEGVDRWYATRGAKVSTFTPSRDW